jgi:hypothetical protein
VHLRYGYKSIAPMTRKILFVSFTSKEERWVLVLGGWLWNTGWESCRVHLGLCDGRVD